MMDSDKGTLIAHAYGSAFSSPIYHRFMSSTYEEWKELGTQSENY